MLGAGSFYNNSTSTRSTKYICHYRTVQIVNTLNWILLVSGTLNNHSRSQENVIKSENQKLTTVTTYGLVFTSLIVFFQ